MAIYEYQCEHHGVFEVTRPLGTAPPSVACGACGAQAPRIVSLPCVRTGARSAWIGAMDRAQKSRHEPEVVTSLPPAGVSRQTVKMTPALRSLPRP